MARTPNTEPTIVTNSEQDQTQPESRLESMRRRAIMAGLAIGLTLAASWGANKAAENKPSEMPTQRTYELKDGRTIGEGEKVGTFDIIPGESATVRLPGVEFAKGVREQDTSFSESLGETTDIKLDWARKFDLEKVRYADPNGPESIKLVAERVQQLQAEGWTIDSITTQGFASDEGDDRDGENPGFGMPTNEKNIKLSDKRAGTVDGLLKQQLEQTLGQEAASELETRITKIGGEEVRDDELAAKIAEKADEMDIPTDDLVMQYNRDPDSLPEDAQETLEGLREDRFVRVSIEASRMVTLPGGEEVEKIIIIPIFIPIFKRKKQPSTPPPPPKQKFPHAPREIGDTRPGYSRVSGHNKDPNTHNGGHSKGSGGHFAAKVHTTHRGNQARKH